MGLDMYLRAKKTVPREEAEMLVTEQPDKYYPWRNEWVEIVNVDPVEVVKEVAYWRKANAIHNWFVQNVQGGVDECEPHPATREQLAELKGLAEEALEGKGTSKELPPVGGFFFGPTDDLEWYREGLRETVKQLAAVEAMDDSWTFEYQSSW